jgi:hypothetical protein
MADEAIKTGKLFEAAPEFKLLRDQTILEYGFKLDSWEAASIRAMTDAYFSMGMDRMSQVMEMLESGELPKELFWSEWKKRLEEMQVELSEAGRK